MTQPSAEIDEARAAVELNAWVDAYKRFSSADRGSFEPRDLEGFADAAWWMSRMDESLMLRQKAYAALAATGDDVRAGGVAARLAVEHFLRGETAVGGGWLGKAHRHLDEQPEGFALALLSVVEATVARFSGDQHRAIEIARRATDIGRRIRDPNAIALGIYTEGLALIASGRVDDGVRLLDEAMTSVVAGELSDYYTGVVYCNVIEACLSIADVRRAGEWSEAARAWCDSVPPESPYPGLCRVNRAEVAMLSGAWTQAEAEATRAGIELMPFSPHAAGTAAYHAAEIRRRMGDLAGAERLFAQAHSLGVDPQPGLALVRAGQGKWDSAEGAIAAALGGGAGDPPHRAKLLVAYVEVALGAGKIEAARDAAAELREIASSVPTPALAAAAAMAGGAVLVAEGETAAALDPLRAACATWQELRMPFESARARVLYARALRHLGNDDDASLELRAALSAFERLGAEGEARAVTTLLDHGATLPSGLTHREVEVLRLVATGKSNRDIASALVISEHTVARHLQNIFGKIGVSSRSAATAFAFEHGLA